MKDQTDGQLEKELLFAMQIGTTSLQKCINSIKQIENVTDVETIISLDFAPHSFYFEKTKKDTGILVGNGGIIFHDISNGVGTHGAPSFSVSIGDDRTPHWEIHT